MVPKNLVIIFLLILFGEISNVSSLFGIPYSNWVIKAAANKLKANTGNLSQWAQATTTPSSLSINYSMPHIFNKTVEDIIKPNANYSILCLGNRPLKWTFPEFKTETNKTLTSFKTDNVTSPIKEYQYGLRLEITNMSYHYVGFYNCHFNDTEDIGDKNNENNKIYLYVDDVRNLAVDDHKSFFLYPVIGSNFVMPCRPTSPDVNVTLKTYDLLSLELIQPNVLIDKTSNTTFIYNPFYGFTSNHTIKEEGNEYICTFQRGSESIMKYVYVNIEPSITDLPPTIVVDENKGHTVEGGNISLRCQISETNRVTFSWTTPTGNSIPYSSLFVMNVTLNDTGVYVCNVADHQNHSSSSNITIKVFSKGVHFINMSDVDYSNNRVGKSGDAYLELKASVWGHPKPNFAWFRNVTMPLLDGQKYEISYTNYSNQTDDITILKIKNLEVKDTGCYTLLGKNKYENKTLQFQVNVTGKPSAILLSDNFHLRNEEGKVICIAEGNPTPDISWEYKSCSRSECKYSFVEGKVKEHEGIKAISEIAINATEPGFVKCKASNTEGSNISVIRYQVTDVPGGFAITGFADTAIVDTESKTAKYAMGENISIKCSADSSNYSQVTWLLGNNVIQETERITLKSTSTNYSNTTTLNIDNSNQNDSGEYTCRVNTSNGKEETRSINLSIEDHIKVEIVETNMKEEMVVDFPKPVKMFCKAKGLPKPSIEWYKDDVILKPNEPRISFSENKKILVFNETVVEDAGTYKCKVAYKNEFDEREVKLRFKNASRSQVWLVYIIVFLVAALVASIIFLIARVRKERKLKREMQLLGLANFEKGAVDNINPELGIDDQAELLPYDKKWEFPIEQLKLGKLLGSGAFGVVLKGEAKHIVEGEPLTTVAVKMVKKNADNTYLKALASELKIMVHLGKHLNVVNLLGACTKNVAKRELLVIVEYCRYGNLQNYLLKHREHFVNQIDPQTEKVNYLIGQELLDRTYSVSSNRSNINSPLMKYASLAFADSANSFNMSSPSAMGDYRANPNTQNTEANTLSQGDDSITLSNNSTQPEWRSNYKGDYKGNVNPISTRDLIAYAFQIARGMEYLASRKVLHGDLAARNILLSEENIVKICDFGLAKSMYKNENYRKRGDCPLPVKWMAIESIRDRVFSTQSDCWSYGIVMWELFSMGRTPYPGMHADETFYNKLVLEGYRLERPEFCPKEMYQIMRECWSVKPALRPSFTKLTERVGTLLEDTLRKHYIDLNDPYLLINTKMLEGRSDYLSMLSPPNFDVIVSPHYVNDVFTQSPPPEDGYMSMKPVTIFSPRVTDDEVFNFNMRNRKNCPSVEVDNHELSPMLRAISEADSEASPGSPNGVSNPSYHRPPTVTNSIPSEVLKSVDNYVNMPENKKCLLKDKSVPGIKLGSIIDNKKEKYHYVNENNQDWYNVQV